MASTSLVYWRYGFKLTMPTIRLSFTLFLMVCLCFVVTFLPTSLWLYLIEGVIALFGCWYCYRQLDKRIDIHNLFRSFLQRKKAA